MVDIFNLTIALFRLGQVGSDQLSTPILLKLLLCFLACNICLDGCISMELLNLLTYVCAPTPLLL